MDKETKGVSKSRSRSQNKSKSKGSAFERLVSGMLDKWWKVGAKTFWRTTNSGGWKEPGDIAPRMRSGQGSIFFPFVIECKHYRKIRVFDILKDYSHLKNLPVLHKWWDQVTLSQMQEYFQRDALIKHEIIRLLIFRPNNYPIMVAISQADGTQYPEYQLGLTKLLANTVSIKVHIDAAHEYIIVPFDVYITYITKEMFSEGLCN